MELRVNKTYMHCLRDHPITVSFSILGPTKFCLEFSSYFKYYVLTQFWLPHALPFVVLSLFAKEDGPEEPTG